MRSLLTASPRLLAVFEGRGKTAVGDDGRRLDTTSSGYDFSFVLGLRTGASPTRTSLRPAFLHRQDGAARAKGEKYVAKTVQHALELAAKSKPQGQGQPVGLDFEVSRVVVLDSNPPVYLQHDVAPPRGVIETTTCALEKPPRWVVPAR